LHRHSVDGEPPARQHPGIGDEQSLWPVAMNITRHGRDAKRRTFQQRNVTVVAGHGGTRAGGPSARRTFFTVDEAHRVTISR
jgi:hypothetical protein